MGAPERYGVPMDELDAVQVPAAQQVQEERAAAHPDATAWAGPSISPYGDGATPDGDGD